jgi:NTE family protein
MSDPSTTPPSAPTPPGVAPVTLDPTNERGYVRDAASEAAFQAAAESLRQTDGWDSGSGTKELVADLALEGGGVKGLGLVGAVLVLDEAGYRFQRVAGTSAGAIAASIIAALSKAIGSDPTKHRMTELKGFVGGLTFTKFMPEGKIHHFIEGHLGKFGQDAAEVATLALKSGLYPGTYLTDWLTPILGDLGVEHFSDLKITRSDDPEMSLPDGHEYRLMVNTSDITRGQLVRLPWDYPLYGHKADEEDVVPAIRASMSIPFFFEPVTFPAYPANVTVPGPGGGTREQTYDSGEVSFVDGGMLQNFPIEAFDRVDGAPPRWPTIGVKLSAFPQHFEATQACESALAVGIHCLRTMTNEWDNYQVEATTAARTIFVDNAGLKATDFDLTLAQQNELFANGVNSATSFVMEMAAAGHVPRTAEESRQHVITKRGPIVSPKAV